MAQPNLSAVSPSGTLTYTVTAGPINPCGPEGQLSYQQYTYSSFNYQNNGSNYPLTGGLVYYNSPGSSQGCPPSGIPSTPISLDASSYGAGCDITINSQEGGTYYTQTLTCPAPPVTGYVDPKYIVVGITYAPPGPSPNTWVKYTNSTYVGVTESLKNSFTHGSTQTVSLTSDTNIPGVFEGKITASQSTSNSQTTTSSSSVTTSVQVQSGEQTFGTGNYFAPVNNDYDIIWIWLNPVVIFSIGSSGPPVWNGYGFDMNDQSDLDVVGIPLGYLNGDFGPMPEQYLASTNRSWAANQIWPSGQGPALTTADFAQVASTDPFSQSSYGASNIGYAPPPSTPDNRFTLSQCNGQDGGLTSINYDQGSPNVSAGIYPCNLIYTNLTTQAQSISNTYSQTFSVDTSFSGSAFFTKFTLSLNNSNTLSWTTEAQASITNSTTSTASLSVQGPNCNNTPPSLTCNPEYDAGGNEPIQFNVYQDNMYGTFMFAPIHYY